MSDQQPENWLRRAESNLRIARQRAEGIELLEWAANQMREKRK